MAVQTTRTLPAQFIEDLGKDLAKQVTAQSGVPAVATTGTPVCATTCVAKSFPRSSTNCAGKFLTVSVAII